MAILRGLVEMVGLDGSGWSSENNPWGGGSGSGVHWGGGSGNGNGGGMVIPVVAAIHP